MTVWRLAALYIEEDWPFLRAIQDYRWSYLRIPRAVEDEEPGFPTTESGCGAIEGVPSVRRGE